MTQPADIKQYAQPRAVAAGLLWPVFEQQIEVESHWEHWSSPGVVKSSPTGSKGLGQLNSRFYPESDWADPYRNIDTAIAVMAGYVKTFGTYRKALAAYNWGPGNVGGYTDSQGRVHPAWDGTRAWRCPHEAAVAQCRTAQRDHYLDLILGPDWKEPGGSAPAAPSGITYEDYRDPAPAGTFAAPPKGIILHGSRSGAAGNPKGKEYLGTARYEQSNPDGLGWHATIGEGVVAVHLAPNEWGWHARAASKLYLGVEFAQATADEPITDGQVAAFVDWVRTRVLAVWPGLPLAFPTHAELDGTAEYGGYRDGKTDVFPKGAPATEQLRAKILAALGKEAPVTPSPYAVGPGILTAMQERGDQPATDELFFKHGDKDEWSEAYGTSGSRYLYLVSLNRVFRYDPAA